MMPGQPVFRTAPGGQRGLRLRTLERACAPVFILCCLASRAPAQALPALNDSLLVSTDWLATRAGDSGLVVIEVERTSEAWAAGHIPGARLLLLSSITTRRGALLYELPPVPVLDSVLEAVGVSNGHRVVIYGNPVGASRLFFTLDYLGLGDRAALLDGGLAKWRAEGRPVSTDSGSVAHGTIEPRVRPEVLVDAPWVRAHLADSSTAILDARSPSEYYGEAAGEGIVRPGHIPGASSFFWRESFTGTAVPILKDPVTLQNEFERLGVGPDDQVVTYCQVGVQGSWLYFVARYLGYSPRLYDGSYEEWSGDPDLPVEGRQP